MPLMIVFKDATIKVHYDLEKWCSEREQGIIQLLFASLANDRPGALSMLKNRSFRSLKERGVITVHSYMTYSRPERLAPIHMLMKPRNRAAYLRYAANVGCTITDGEVYAPTVETAKLLFAWIRTHPPSASQSHR